MSLEELREQNIRLVTEKALECFIKNGINNTRVSEIAAESGLTQRSVFRYFPSKDDIVIAAAFCYWERTKAYIARELRRHTRTTRRPVSNRSTSSSTAMRTCCSSIPKG